MLGSIAGQLYCVTKGAVKRLGGERLNSEALDEGTDRATRAEEMGARIEAVGELYMMAKCLLSQGTMAVIENVAKKEIAKEIREEAEKTSFTEHYLDGSGGRWGLNSTRAQNYDIATEYKTQGYTVSGGGGYASEEWIPGPDGRTKGGTFVDTTVTNGSETVRIQTVTTKADGTTPTATEAAAAERIRNSFPDDMLILVPKNK